MKNSVYDKVETLIKEGNGDMVSKGFGDNEAIRIAQWIFTNDQKIRKINLGFN